MANIRIETNWNGIRGLLRSEEIEQCCKEKADVVRAICGDGYETDTYRGINRVHASVRAATPQAVADNLKNNTLAKALGAVIND